MKIPVQVTFKNLPVSEAVEDDVRLRASKLEKVFDRITRCDVTIALPHRHHNQGRLYSVRIDLSIPHHKIVINRDHAEDHTHEDVYIAVRDAFDVARRQIEDSVQLMRYQIKTNPVAHKTTDKDMPHASKR